MNNLPQTPVEKRLKMTQITQFISPNTSTFDQLDKLASHDNNNNLAEKKAKKKSGKKAYKLNFNQLNDSRAMNQPVISGETKYFQKTPEVISVDEDTTSNIPFECPICKLDLTNSIGRQAHVTECLDRGFSKGSTVIKHKPKPLEPPEPVPVKIIAEPKPLLVEDAVPNCPICGKELKTLNVFVTVFIK